MTENQNLDHDYWKYFSQRADHSANILRGVLFTSANAGMLAIASGALTVITKDGPAVPTFAIITTFVSFILFLLALTQVIESWALQKKKSIERRKLIAKLYNCRILHYIESELMLSGKNDKNTEKQAEEQNSTILSQKNSEFDCDAIWFLLMGYGMLAITLIVWTICQ